ncbi:MAG TPA: hypothetical protein VGN60_05790 [Devosia sp.]|nr:hypothetical protein [Devosia sp.]
MTSRWRHTSPAELAEWLANAPACWAFAGGWALDLWAGEPGRAHSDIEITCLRRDLDSLVSALSGFEIVAAQNKQLSPWNAGAVPSPPFSLWLRRYGESQWDFEVLAEAHNQEAWQYRRDARICLPMDRLFRRSAEGWSIIAPEVQLLYKCKAPRDKDIADLHHFMPLLDDVSRNWLFAAVALAHPETLPLLPGGR